MGGDLVTFWLIGEHHLNTAVMKNPAAPKYSRSVRLGDSFTTFQHHDQHQNQHHDWKLLNKFWLLITFVFYKKELKLLLKSLIKFSWRNCDYWYFRDCLTMIKDGKISVGSKLFLCKFFCFIPCVCTIFHQDLKVQPFHEFYNKFTL